MARFLALVLLLVGCAPAPKQLDRPKADPTTEAWYGECVEQLRSLNRAAEEALRRGRTDDAAALITKGQPLLARLLAAPRPNLSAMEAVSDSDELYGRMLLKNRHYGWARLLFQKNFARWKNWRPETPDTIRRRKAAESAIAECDRHLLE